MNAIQEMRETRQKLRDKAAFHARTGRRHETNANNAEAEHFKLLYRSEAVSHFAQYRAFRWASSSVFHAMRRAEMHEKKSQVVNTLRAMA
jgi:hypothetical protein